MAGLVALWQTQASNSASTTVAVKLPPLLASTFAVTDWSGRQDGNCLKRRTFWVTAFDDMFFLFLRVGSLIIFQFQGKAPSPHLLLLRPPAEWIGSGGGRPLSTPTPTLTSLHTHTKKRASTHTCTNSAHWMP